MGQNKQAARILEAARAEIDTLCSPTLAGRGYVDDGHRKAAAYLGQRFLEIGLRAPFEQRGTSAHQTYWQTFPLQINLASEAHVQLDEESLQAGTDFIVNRFSGSGEIDAPVVDLGYGLNKKKYKRIKGKVALFRAGWPAEIANDSEKKAQYKSLAKVMDRLLALRKAGPVAIIVVQKKLTAAFTRENIGIPVVELLAARYESKAKNAQIRVVAEMTTLQSQNVIGFIPGKKEPEKMLIISAHYDHLGRLEDAIFTGANDNASGTSMLLSLAEHFTQPKHQPDYSLMFIAFGGEETGLIGSNFYVNQQPLYPLEKTQFILNLDLMGNGIDGITAVGGKDYPDIFDRLVKTNEKLEAVPKVLGRPNAPNSDHYFFLKAGVPGFFIYTLGGPPHYHDVNDNPSNIVLSKYVEVRALLIQFLEDF
ncbi:MAG: M28 family peptidase [Bacteroidota bacterium]